ncbi:hypothetical protein HK405_001804, partial [Cladochytrium tenue]
YVEFKTEAAATAAIGAMKDGSFELGGLRLRTWRAVIGGKMPDGMSALERMPVVAPLSAAVATAGGTAGAATNPSGTAGGVISGLANPAIASALQNAIQKVQAQVMEESGSLDENVSISASQRYAIMQKLMRSHEEAKV